MPDQLAVELSGLGVNLDPATAFTSAVVDFGNQNLSPSQILSAGATLSGAGEPNVSVDLGINIPRLGKLASTVSRLANSLTSGVPSTSGQWESIHYASDLNAHHPKFKFLFKVTFSGFGVRDFFHFVTRCDKPKVRFNHQDVNYYNFRTRVLVSTVYDPLTITFLDEIGNTVNTFFANYLANISGSGSGNYGINNGFGSASSTKPYENAYSTGRSITVEQIYANGTRTNRFVFINPRVEAFDFDELSMEENAGSLLNMTFSYDALQCYTVSGQVLHKWGQTDLLAGGGTSGPENAGDTSQEAIDAATSATGQNFSNGSNPEVYQPGIVLANQNAGLTALGTNTTTSTGNSTGIVGSDQDIVSGDIQNTLSSIKSGDNLKFGGQQSPTSTDSLALPNSATDTTTTSQPDPVLVFSQNSPF